jgi:hypothetical protein
MSLQGIQSALVVAYLQPDLVGFPLGGGKYIMAASRSFYVRSALARSSSTFCFLFVTPFQLWALQLQINPTISRFAS